MFPTVRKATPRLIRFIYLKSHNIKPKVNQIHFVLRQAAAFFALRQKLISLHFACLPLVLQERKKSLQTAMDMQSIISEVDTLMRNNEFEKAYQILLPYKDSDEVEILWRLAVTMYDFCQDPNTDNSTCKRLAIEGYNLIKRAFALNNNHPEVYRTLAVLTDEYFKHEGLRSRFLHCVEIKELMMKAYELNPDDCHTLYCIAHWNFYYAELPWTHKQIVKLYHGRNVHVTYEDALPFFEKALEREKANKYKTKFYVPNIVMVGLCHQKMGNVQLAIKYYQEALTHTSHHRHQEEALTLARKQLQDLGQKIPNNPS